MAEASKGHNASKGEGAPKKGPLKDVNVHVDTQQDTAKNGATNHSIKADKSLKQEIERAIEGAAKEGCDKQLDAVDRTIADAAKKMDPSSIKRIRGRITGKADGKPVKKEFDVPVEQGGTKPDAPAKK